MRTLALLATVTALSACGLGETAVTAAAGGKSKAQEIEQAQAMKQQVVEEIEKANQQARDRINEAESQ